MSRSRAMFKLALRYCKQHEDQLKADACARSLNLHDSKGFWKNIKRVNCNAATKYATSVGGVCGDNNIASLWRDHFNNLYNSGVDDRSKDNFFAQLKSSQRHSNRVPLLCKRLLPQPQDRKKVNLPGQMASPWRHLYMAIADCLLT